MPVSSPSLDLTAASLDLTAPSLPSCGPEPFDAGSLSGAFCAIAICGANISNAVIPKILRLPGRPVCTLRGVLEVFVLSMRILPT